MKKNTTKEGLWRFKKLEIVNEQRSSLEILNGVFSTVWKEYSSVNKLVLFNATNPAFLGGGNRKKVEDCPDFMTKKDRHDDWASNCHRRPSSGKVLPLPVLTASASLTFHCSATWLSRGSSGFGALSRAWIDSRTVRICSAGLHLSAKTERKTITNKCFSLEKKDELNDQKYPWEYPDKFFPSDRCWGGRSWSWNGLSGPTSDTPPVGTVPVWKRPLRKVTAKNTSKLMNVDPYITMCHKWNELPSK